jgi:hypothetical protein
MTKRENPKMKNSEKGKRNGTISALIERHYHAGTRLLVALALVLTVASVVAAQVPILHIYLPIILKTFSGGQVSDATGFSADIGSTYNREALVAQQTEIDCIQNPHDYGCKIKVKTEGLVDEVCNTTTLLSQDDLGILTPLQKENLNNKCTLARGWVDNTKPEEFKAMGLRRDAGGGSGAVMEYVGPDTPEHKNDGDDDGICKPKGKNDKATAAKDGPTKGYKEWCAEVQGDGIGDEDGFCELIKGGGKPVLEPCVQVSGVAAIESQDENYDEEKLKGIEAAFEDNTTAMKAANIQLAANLEELRTLRATSAETFSVYKPEECLGLMDIPEPFPQQERTSYYTLYGFLVPMTSMAAGHDTCDSAANLDVLGANGSPVCVATAVLKGLSVAMFELFEQIDDAITGARVDNAAQCLESIHSQVITNSVKLDHIYSQVITNTGKLDEVNGKLETVLYNQANKLELRRVHLQVTELKEKSEFLVSASEAGKPIDGVKLISVKVAESPTSFINVFDNTDFAPLEEKGLYLVKIDLPQEARNAKIFAFEVEHEDPTELPHYGLTHFHRGTQ